MVKRKKPDIVYNPEYGLKLSKKSEESKTLEDWQKIILDSIGSSEYESLLTSPRSIEKSIMSGGYDHIMDAVSYGTASTTAATARDDSPLTLEKLKKAVEGVKTMSGYRYDNAVIDELSESLTAEVPPKIEMQTVSADKGSW